MTEILILAAGLVALGLASWFGWVHESRDGLDWATPPFHKATRDQRADDWVRAWMDESGTQSTWSSARLVAWANTVTHGRTTGPGIMPPSRPARPLASRNR